MKTRATSKLTYAFPLFFITLTFVLSPRAHGDFVGTRASAKPNAQMQSVLDALQSLGGKPIETLTAEEARLQPTPADAVQLVMKQQRRSPPPDTVARGEERTIPGAQSNLPVRIYRPRGTFPMPVIVYFHGGGWVIGNKEVYDATPRALAQQARAIVVSVDYRLAPENKFPAAHDDAFAAYHWVVQNIQSLGGMPGKIAVVGESAGGNLAVNVAIRARDQGFDLPAGVVAIYPVAGGAMNTTSYQEYESAKPLNKVMMDWFFGQYLNRPEQASDPRIDLIHADLHGLPPMTVITAQIDPLKSEGDELAVNLRLAGNTVQYQNFEGVTHEFFGMAYVVDQARLAQDFVVQELKRELCLHD